MYILPPDEIRVEEKRFLEVDNRLVLPTGLLDQFNVTSRDVIHRFALPTLGGKGRCRGRPAKCGTCAH